MVNHIENPDSDKGYEHWKALADKLQTLVDQHGGKPTHIVWTIQALQNGEDIKSIKSDYRQQRDKLEIYYRDIRDLLDEEFK